METSKTMLAFKLSLFLHYYYEWRGYETSKLVEGACDEVPNFVILGLTNSKDSWIAN
jgi:hypothetical protein